VFTGAAMNRIRKTIYYIDKIITIFEIVIAFTLLIIIAINVIETLFEMSGINIVIITMDFERILSRILTLVIGLEFIKMLCKHTPESVVDVLLFTIARLLVIYHESATDMLIGVAAIAGLFAAKKFLIDRKNDA